MYREPLELISYCCWVLVSSATFFLFATLGEIQNSIEETSCLMKTWITNKWFWRNLHFRMPCLCPVGVVSMIGVPSA